LCRCALTPLLTQTRTMVSRSSSTTSPASAGRRCNGGAYDRHPRACKYCTIGYKNLSIAVNLQSAITALLATCDASPQGGPLGIDWTKASVPAILDAHYPGEMGGDVSRMNAAVSSLFLREL
jgi:hypothetical protein